MILKLRIPLPPSANRLFTNRRGTKHRIKTNEYRKWADAAILLITHQLSTFKDKVPIKQKQFWKLSVSITFKDWRRDLDNCLKSICDAICKATGLDDRYLMRIMAMKIVGGKPGVQAILRISL